MHSLRQGRGAPPLVFVHGFACAHEDWGAQVAALSASHETVTCDLRGHGKTPARPEECSIEVYGQDVASLVADFPGAILVGHSMGCRVVLEANRVARERVAGIVLIDGSRIGSGAPQEAEAAARAAIGAAGYAAFAENLFTQMFFQPSPEAAAIVARARRLPAEIGAALWPRMVRWDAEKLEPALEAVRVPLLVIQSTAIGAERRRVPLKPAHSSPWLDLVRQRVPDAKIEVISGPGHFVQLEASGAVNRLIASFAAARR